MTDQQSHILRMRNAYIYIVLQYMSVKLVYTIADETINFYRFYKFYMEL